MAQFYVKSVRNFKCIQQNEAFDRTKCEDRILNNDYDNIKSIPVLDFFSLLYPGPDWDCVCL